MNKSLKEINNFIIEKMKSADFASVNYKDKEIFESDYLVISNDFLIDNNMYGQWKQFLEKNKELNRDRKIDNILD